MSYSDLQLRVYVLDELPADIVARIEGTAWDLVVPDVTVTDGDPWTRIDLSYDRFYGDYGGTAHVDLRVRRFEAATVVFAGMRADAWETVDQLEAIVASMCWTPGTDECCPIDG